MRLKFYLNCRCIRSVFQNCLFLCRESQHEHFLLNLLTWNSSIIEYQICKFCHLLPAFLIRDIQNDGLVIWENKLSPSLQVGGKIQREAHDKDSKLWWESPLLLSHGTTQSTTSSAQAGDLSQHPTRQNRTEKTCSNQIETPKFPIKNEKKNGRNRISETGKFVAGAEFL